MYIDYISLNKACPKDPFPLPRIDQIVDSTSGCDLLCFLDAYSGFHQIPMSREDKEHTTFIIVDDLFCYVSMPPRGPTIDVFFNLSGGRCRRRQHPPGARHRRHLQHRWWMLPNPSVAPPRGPAIDVFFNLGGGRYWIHR
jgi:hypothetical protein